MRCHEARKRLNRYRWRAAEYSHDRDLVEHLDTCHSCGQLVRAEESLREDLELLRRTDPPPGPDINTLKETITSSAVLSRSKHMLRPISEFFKTHRRLKLAVGFVLAVILFTALVPFNFTETVGYEVSISGIDRNIAMDNREIKSLLYALGMDRDKASGIMDSLDRKEIHLYVGECRETCHLKISDLKSRRDVRIVVKAIADLGCCEVDKIMPIFRNESTSLIGHATRKLFS